MTGCGVVSGQPICLFLQHQSRSLKVQLPTAPVQTWAEGPAATTAGIDVADAADICQGWADTAPPSEEGADAAAAAKRFDAELAGAPVACSETPNASADDGSGPADVPVGAGAGAAVAGEGFAPGPTLCCQ
mmetsp:Transcript_63490/g.206990  ORF Transcript_63490/g.206990 Transcript_63490/m.206990 type:complete len:131 (-) Transcript_63490:426-818(-)